MHTLVTTHSFFPIPALHSTAYSQTWFAQLARATWSNPSALFLPPAAPCCLLQADVLSILAGCTVPGGAVDAKLVHEVFLPHTTSLDCMRDSYAAQARAAVLVAMAWGVTVREQDGRMHDLEVEQHTVLQNLLEECCE
jgi:hypothetical protein